MKKEYRVVWKRKPFIIDPDGGGGKTELFDPRPKSKKYVLRREADRFMLLLGPEPWKYFKKKPDDYVCCSGNMCGCGGLTYKEQADEKHGSLSKIEYLRLDEREVGEWKEVVP